MVTGKCATDQFEIPPPKRQRLSVTSISGDGDTHRARPSAAKSGSTPAAAMEGDVRSKSSVSSRDAAATAGSTSPAGPEAAATKSKRVRTGCLTCRERHLKCDEAVPDCLNCRKSNRECKRGVRLNFIDVQVKDPPQVPPTLEWSGAFTFCFSFCLSSCSDLSLKRCGSARNQLTVRPKSSAIPR